MKILDIKCGKSPEEAGILLKFSYISQLNQKLERELVDFHKELENY
jgi:hypothetical protein